MTIKAILFWIFLAFVVPSGVATAQTSNDELTRIQQELVSPWLIAIEGDATPLVLKLKAVTRRTGGGFNLETAYGQVGSGQGALKEAVLIVEGQTRKLLLMTPSNHKMDVVQGSDGGFQGTFTTASGRVRAVKLTKISTEALRLREEPTLAEKPPATPIAQVAPAPPVAPKVPAAQAVQANLNAAPTIETAAADVPQKCSAFLGGWSGVPRGGPRQWLWVVSVDAKCVVKYEYTGNSAVPTSFKTGEIRDNFLFIPFSNGLTLSFELSGNELLARSSSGNGVVGGTLQKINLAGDSLREIRLDQKAAESVAYGPPAADAPANCAAFYGNWTGQWRGASSPTWLRVVGVGSACHAKFSFSNLSEAPKVFVTTKIKDNELPIACGSGGVTCIFEVKGDQLWGRATNGNATLDQIALRKSE